MNLTKRDLLLLPIIALLLVWIAARLLAPQEDSGNRVQAPVTGSATASAKMENQAGSSSPELFDITKMFQTNMPSDVRQRQLDRASQSWGRDPFFALTLDQVNTVSRAEKNAGDLVLMAISLKGSVAMAIVNHTLIREGDLVFGMHVSQIEKDKVVFDENGQSVVLRFGGLQ